MIVEFKVKAVELRKSRTLMKEKRRCLLELCKGECGQLTLYVCVQLPSSLPQMQILVTKRPWFCVILGSCSVVDEVHLEDIPIHYRDLVGKQNELMRGLADCALFSKGAYGKLYGTQSGIKQTLYVVLILIEYRTVDVVFHGNYLILHF